jgi:hypothetical protein
MLYGFCLKIPRDSSRLGTLSRRYKEGQSVWTLNSSRHSNQPYFVSSHPHLQFILLLTPTHLQKLSPIHKATVIMFHTAALATALALAALPSALAQGNYSVAIYSSQFCAGTPATFTGTNTNSTSCLNFPGVGSLNLIMHGSCTSMFTYAGADCTDEQGEDIGADWEAGCQTWSFPINSVKVVC